MGAIDVTDRPIDPDYDPVLSDPEALKWFEEADEAEERHLAEYRAQSAEDSRKMDEWLRKSRSNSGDLWVYVFGAIFLCIVAGPVIAAIFLVGDLLLGIEDNTR